jgi:hypothetical protein
MIATLFRRGAPKAGEFAKLKLALIADDLTDQCLRHECQVFPVTPLNARMLFATVKPDLLFVESAWDGHCRRWRYKIAAYPDHPERNNAALKRVVALARERGIPAVFWNREDGVHFERFIASAALFDRVLTVDASCLPRYRERLGTAARIGTLMFAAQPAIHAFDGIGERIARACFPGSYSTHIHASRRERQDMLLAAAASTIGLTIFDRNSRRKSGNYRFPPYPGSDVRPRVSHAETAAIYRGYRVSLNVNTIEDSETMFSRRLVEILSCGGMAVTTPALAISKHFNDYCHCVANTEEARERLTRLAAGYTTKDIAMMREGADFVHSHHGYRNRLQQILEMARS